jgi:hypothetical protein
MFYLEVKYPSEDMTHHWKDTYKDETMLLLAFFMLQGLHQKHDNKLFSPKKKVLKMPILSS